MPEAGPATITPQPRYSYLETIRQYARDRLVESGKIEEARDRHFAYYEALASRRFSAPAQDGAARRHQILLEQDNLRAAVEWGIERYPQRVLDLHLEPAPLISDQMPGSEFIDWTTWPCSAWMRCRRSGERQPGSGKGAL